jgi:hypothetical protein
MDEPDFRAGDVSIRYLEEHPDLLASGGDWTLAAALAAAAWLEDTRRKGAAVSTTGTTGPTGATGVAGAPGGRRDVERSAWQRALEEYR